MIALILSTVLLFGTQQEMLPYQGEGFTIQYPSKHTRLQPASAKVPFQLQYRRHSLFRLETERLTQTIDLSDENFAAIFLEIQLEDLRDRVSAPLEVKRLHHFSWGTGVEFLYFLPARSGKGNRRDQVTEVVATHGETLYRFTYWIPERDLDKVARHFQEMVESFQPDSPPQVKEANPDSNTGGHTDAPAARYCYSLTGVQTAIHAYRGQLGQEDQSDDDLAEMQAHLAESLGWKAYLEGSVSPEELDEMQHAAVNAINLAPEDADSHQARAWSAYHGNRMVEMETAVQEAIRLDPEDGESYLLHAIWYSFNPAQSEKLAEQALERDPDLVGAYYVKASAARRSGNLQQAREALERAVELDPAFAAAHLELAQVLRESGDATAALQANRRAAALDPGNVEARFALAVALRQAGHLDEAIAEYGIVIKLDPELPEAYYNLAVLHLQEKQQPEIAAQYFEYFLELDPESEKAGQIRDWLKSH